MIEADVAILGAGCAGLSVAWQLLERGYDGRVVLVDPRSGYARDRTWCFWNCAPHDFEDLVADRWAAWRVRGPAGPWVERSAPGRVYERLPADRFYDRVVGRIERSADVTLRLGVRAGAIRDGASAATVETDAGPIRARRVLDSRPPPRVGAVGRGAPVALLQHFEGWEVRLDEDRFEPSVATLMDFRWPPQPARRDGGVCFTYVLPRSPREALVEVTWFAPDVLPPDAYRAYLEGYFREIVGARSFEVGHRERGVLPMRAAPFPLRPSPRVHRIGLAGGAAKPSTGYAFQAIQDHARRVADAVVAGTLDAPIPPRSRLAHAQDGVFLSYLARDNRAAIEGLVGLFERVEPDLLTRFLSDRASPRESVTVMRAMPPGPMLREAVRVARSWRG